MNRPLLALVGCGLALGCATAPTKPTASAGGTSTAGLVTGSPMRRQLEDIASQVAEEARDRMKGKALSEERVARMEDALGRLWSRERALARTEWSVRRALDPAEAAQVSAVLASPLTQRLLALALDHDREPEVEEKVAADFTRSLDENEARVKRIVRFLEAIELIEGLEVSRALSVYGGTAIANEAAADGKRMSQGEVQSAAKKAIEEGMSQEAREVSVQATLLSVAYSLRKVTDAELDEFVAFWESDLGKKYRKALQSGFILAVQISTVQTMQAMRGEPLSLPPGMEGMDGGPAAAAPASPVKRGYSFPIPEGFRELRDGPGADLWSKGGMVLVSKQRPAIAGESETFLASIVVIPVPEPDPSMIDQKHCAEIAEEAAEAAGAKLKEAVIRPHPGGAQCRYIVEDQKVANRMAVGVVKGLGPQWVITCNMDARDAAALKACGEVDARWSFDAR